MIRPNWEIFSAKFSHDKELTFEWFSYLLFCREFNLPKGWFGFKNQSGIEKNPIEHDGEVIGFQAKFYSTSLSDHKKDFIEMLEKSKRDYENISKILIYTNQLWGQGQIEVDGSKKMSVPKALTDITDKAKELNMALEWREASFFESEFVCLENDDLSKYFFTEKALQGWQRFDDWSNTKAKIEKEYFVDDDIKVITPHHKNNNELNVIDGMNEIREKLKNGGVSIRLVGLSGVGKTRFAQALFDARIGENSLDHRAVWYCDLGDSPNPPAEHFIEELVHKNRPYILIVDNCGQDTHANLTKKIQLSQIALMTIEYDVKDDLPEKTDVYKLKPISVEVVKKVIERHYSNINDLNSRKIAEFSGGNYRLALAIASNIERTDNLALLTDSELFERLFWQQGHINEQLLKIAQNFALVYSFNIEDSGEVNSELDFLAGLSRVDADTAIEAIEALKNKDIVQQRGKWRAILPHALANHLAKELISKKLVPQIDKFTKQMPARLQTSFIRRLSYLHDVPKIKELVSLWFDSDGWLGRKILDDSYDSQDLVKIRLLSLISEDQLLALIEQKHALDSKFLTRENPHFIELSRLIRTLAYQENNFKKAFELLVYFAQSEKEGEKNNSIRDLVTSLFRLYTSETLADLEHKKKVLTELKSHKDHQSILLDCISKALNFHEYGYFLRESTESGKFYDYGYQPKTYDEICDWVEFLLEILNELDSQGVVKVRKIFTDHLKEIIWTCRKFDIVKSYLEKFNRRSFFSSAHNQVLNIIKWNIDELKEKNPQLLHELVMLEKTLRPRKNNISELIKSYVLVSDTDLYRMTKNSDDEYSIKIPDFDNYEDLMCFIGEQLQDVQLLEENLYYLIHANSGWLQNSHLVNLGQKAASVFVNVSQCVDVLRRIEIDPSLNGSEFLLGIVKFFKQHNLEHYHNLINYLAGDLKYRNFADLIIFQTCANDADFSYFGRMLKNKILHSNRGLALAWNKNQKNITNEQFESLIDIFIEIKQNEIVQFELEKECYFYKRVSEKYKFFLLGQVYNIISKGSPLNHFEDVLSFLLQADLNSNDKVFDNVKKFLEKEKYISLHRNDSNFKMLKLLIENNTEKFIKYFVEDDTFMKRFFMKDLVKILAYANSQDVIYWIDSDQEKIYFWLENSRLFEKNSNARSFEESTVGDIVWSDLIFYLLGISSDRVKALEIIFDNHIFRMSRVFSGNWSQAMQTRLPYLYSLRNKLEYKYPELLGIIDIKEKQWLDAIKNQAENDCIEEKQKSERFDW